MTALDDLPVETRLALASAARHLADEFAGTFGVETIELFLVSSYDQFAASARISTFLPLMAERFARQRLKALAKVEGRSGEGVPTVLFLCVHNAGRSQMAAAYLTHLAGDRVEVRSAGSAPAETVNPAVVQALAEEGIDISAEVPKVLTTEAVKESDVVITMGCGDACPIFPGKRYEDWQLDDPAGQGVDAVRPIRDEIRRRIELLIEDIAPEQGGDHD